jgi:hypothetical protein
LIAVFASGILYLSQPDSLRSQIVLRDLTVVDDGVADFNEDYIRSTSGTRYDWDAVLAADVADERQDEFDRLVREVGLPLFRLQQRTSNRDWAGLNEIAEPMYRQLSDQPDKRVDPRREFYICRAVGQSRLNLGQMERAAQPLLRVAELAGDPTSAAEIVIPPLELKAVVNDMMDPLLPIWFDREPAAEAFDSITKQLEKSNASTWPDFCLPHLASLAIGAGRFEQAELLVDSLNDRPPEIRKWSKILKLMLWQARNLPNQERQSLEAQAADQRAESFELAQSVRRQLEELSDGQRAVAMFLLGVLDGNTGDVRAANAAILELLHIPAVYGKRYRSLAAAALYEAAQIAHRTSQKREFEILTNELLRTYPNAYHSRLVGTQNRSEIADRENQ